jgi:flagellum-specific ATP synthase
MLPSTSFITSELNRNEIASRIRRINWNPRGKVTDVIGNLVEAAMPQSQLGSLVEISVSSQQEGVLAEVVGFRENRVLLLPYTQINGIRPGSIVSRQKVLDRIPVGDFLLGRIVDPFMTAIAGATIEIPKNSELVAIDAPSPNPMARTRITKPLGLGVRAIDSLLTFGDGQRVGIMAGSGVGKSVLLGMIARDTDADINVIALIGERGREVKEFLERDLGTEGLARSIVVVVTSDQSPLMKIRGAKAATAIAEHFSRQGKRVLLMMDSLTRVAQAQREIGLSVGEPPTTKGYTPSVFSLLPRLLERTGPQLPGQGNISALYTVLVEGDDFNEPIVDAARSILDGQVNLTRALAAKGHYPAIDVTTSISRVMTDIVPPEQWKLANRMKGLIGTYNESIDLIQIGAYQSGTNPKLDEAIAMMPLIERFTAQDVHDRSNILTAVNGLKALFNNPNPDRSDGVARPRNAQRNS